MKDWRSEAHVKWECLYHVVIIPKYRRKEFYGRMRKRMGEILRDLCRQNEVVLVEGNAMRDHIHMLCARVLGQHRGPGRGADPRVHLVSKNIWTSKWTKANST